MKEVIMNQFFFFSFFEAIKIYWAIFYSFLSWIHPISNFLNTIVLNFPISSPTPPSSRLGKWLLPTMYGLIFQTSICYQHRIFTCDRQGEFFILQVGHYDQGNCHSCTTFHKTHTNPALKLLAYKIQI